MYEYCLVIIQVVQGYLVCVFELTSLNLTRASGVFQKSFVELQPLTGKLGISCERLSFDYF